MKSLLARILGVSKQLLDWFLPILASKTATALEVLMPIAIGIVSRLAMDKLMTGEAKRETAVRELRDAAIAQGVEAGTSILNLAIEAAVANLKAVGK